jgi:hypothetical protein
MKFFLQTAADPAAAPPPPTPELMAEMGRFMEQGFRNGTLVATGGLDPHKTLIESRAGQITVTDGPYSEAKEVSVGWAIVNVDSKEQAIELSRQFWKLVGDGTGTLQRIYDPGEMPSRG